METPMPRSSLRSAQWLTVALLAAAGCTVPPADPLEAAPHVKAFTASATRVDPGDAVTLHWDTENAVEVKIDELRLGTVSGVSGASGDVQVNVNQPSTYVLRVRNQRGASDSAVVTIAVGEAGKLVFTAVPPSITYGEQSTLAWSAPGATSVTLTGSDGSTVDVHGQTSSGSVTVAPTASTTYTLTVGDLTATADVSVLPSVVRFESAPLQLDAGGGAVSLHWQTVGGQKVQVTSPGRGLLFESTDAAQVAAGSFDDPLPEVIDPAQIFTYELIVSAGAEASSRRLQVTFAGQPVVVDFTGPAYVRDPALGPPADGGTPATTVTLHWETRSADAVTLSLEGLEIFRAPSDAIASGSVTLPAPAADAHYQLRASKERGGDATANLLVDVVGLPTLTASVSPMQVNGGEAASLQWMGENVRTIAVIEAGLGTLFTDSGPMLDTGSYPVAPGSQTTYLVLATNGLGDSVTAQATVQVTNPIVLTLSDEGVLRAGQPLTASFSVPGQTDATITGLPHSQIVTRTGSTGFIDISGTGTQLTFSTASGSEGATIDTPFRTSLFGMPVGSTIQVTRYGVLGFGHLDGNNSVDVVLPTRKLEPFTVAPYWESLTVGAGVFWEVRQVGDTQALVVQWSMTTAVFEAIVYATGQIDFEYQSLPATVNGHAGVVGRGTAESLSVTPVAGTGFTFFGPLTSPVALTATAPMTLSGYVTLTSGASLRLSRTIDRVVDARELMLNEVMANSTLGVGGQWAELRNGTDAPVDLTGWSFALADGGAVPLASSTVPARGLLVVGSSTDGALNGDAGVQVALPGFDLSGLGGVTLQRAGLHALAPVQPTAGVATVNDAQNFVLSSSTATVVTSCPATASYGWGGQKGTPGTDTGCGFPYALSPIAYGLFDISQTGTALPLVSDDDDIQIASLAAAPFPYFGTSYASVQVSTNGFITFDSAPASSTNYLSSARPSTSDSNLLLAIFADDCDASDRWGDGQIYVQRLAAGVDPAASAPHWIIQWHHWSHFSSYDDLEFEMKLFDDGVIEYHYGSMTSGTSSAYGSGISANAWIENATGDQALVINANSDNPGLSPYTAFRFVPR